MTHPDSPRPMVALPRTQERVLSSLTFFPNANCVFHLDPEIQRSPNHSGNSTDPGHAHIRALPCLNSCLLLVFMDSDEGKLEFQDTSDQLLIERIIPAL